MDTSEPCNLCGCPNHSNKPCHATHPVTKEPIECHCGHEGHWTQIYLDRMYEKENK